MGGAYPELDEQADAIDMWLAAEEESFGRTLEQGLPTLAAQIERRAGRAATASAPRSRSGCTTPSDSRMT